MYLLIPTAKYAPEDLPNVGKLPQAIYPFGKGVVFDYIYRTFGYSADSIILVSCEGASDIKDYFDKNRVLNLTISEMKKEDLSDLAFTVLYGLNGLSDSEIIINFSDTIIEDRSIDDLSDCFYYSEKSMSSRWTYFTEDNGSLLEILDKPEEDSGVKQKVFAGVFKFSSVQLLRNCLQDSLSDKNQTCSRFYSAVLRYNQICPLKSVFTDKWLDIGHLDNYYNSKLAVEAREFNHISIDTARGILRKTSDDKDKFLGEIKWYLKLPHDVDYCHPRIFSYSLSYSEPFVEMEYYSYHTIHELFLYGKLSYSQWENIFERIAFVVRDMLRYKVEDPDKIRSSLEEMYLHKTVRRISLLECNPFFESYFKHPIQVNGIRFRSLSDILKILKKEISVRLCNIQYFQIIHGDLCFTNVLVDENYNFVKLIDPRGSFGEFDIYGDVRYDLAKLFHSVDGKYDYIIKNLFELNTEGNSIMLNILEPNRSFDLFGLVQSVFQKEIGDQKDNIQFIEALLFLTMIPLHNESLKHQLAMLATGLRILDRVCNIREE